MVEALGQAVGFRAEQHLQRIDIAAQDLRQLAAAVIDQPNVGLEIGKRSLNLACSASATSLGLPMIRTWSDSIRNQPSSAPMASKRLEQSLVARQNAALGSQILDAHRFTRQRPPAEVLKCTTRPMRGDGIEVAPRLGKAHQWGGMLRGSHGPGQYAFKDFDFRGRPGQSRPSIG